MRIFVRVWLILALSLAVSLVGSHVALAQAAAVLAPKPAPAPPTLTPAQAKQVLDVLQDDSKRAQFVAVLENMAKALPAAPAIATPLRPDGVGAQVLQDVSTNLTKASGELVATARGVTDFPVLLHWLTTLAEDPDAKAQSIDVGWKLLVVCAVAGLAEALMMRALRRLRRAIDQMTDDSSWHGRAQPASPEVDAPRPKAVAPDAQPAEMLPSGGGTVAEPDVATGRKRRPPTTVILLRRIPYVLARLSIDLVPVALFAAVAFGLLSTPVGSPATARLVILALVNAYLVCRLAACAARMIVSPASQRLRLVVMTDQTAAYVMVWVRRLTFVSAFGYALSAVATVFGLYPSAQDALLKLVALVDHIFLVIIVLQCRHAVAARLEPHGPARGVLTVLRRRLATSWHYVAIFYIVALWLVWALEVRDGFSRLFHFFIVTSAVLVATRIVAIVLLGALDRLFHLTPETAARYPTFESRADRYYPLLRAALVALIAACSLLALFEVWGLDPINWFVGGALGSRLVAALGAIGLTLLLALLVWEFSNAAIERRLETLAKDMQTARSARLRTLLPMLRTTLLIIIVIVTGLMVLSQIGINTAPLLAGAGVIGVAVGFGSQKLVQDIITGLFLLLENTMQVGDTVTLGGLTGTVEYLSIRTIRLRALDGSVHIIPFSAVTSVTNMTRDYSYAMIDVAVGFNEEPDAIADILRTVASEMRAEAAWKLALVADLEVMGLDRFTDTAWVMRVRIRTQPTRRWAVQREFNRRIKYRFDKLAIESPFTSTRILSTVPAPPPEPAPSDAPSGAAAMTPQQATAAVTPQQAAALLETEAAQT
jgi:small-conductance mechanosensitive channel